MQSLVTLLVVGIALFALGCLTLGLLVVFTVWAGRQIGGAFVRLATKAGQQARTCYNEPLQSLPQNQAS